MNKINIVKTVKLLSMAASVVGMIGASWANSKENESILARLVEERLMK